MKRPLLLASALASAIWLAGMAERVVAQSVDAAGVSGQSSPALPDTRTLLLDVERNQARMEALQRDYTYHVHMEQQETDKHGGVKKTEITDSESLTVDGVRVNRVVARDGKPLTGDEQAKEGERIDKEVAKARERRTKAASKGEATDARGDSIVPLSRILELGNFTNPRRVEVSGRSTLQLDYAGDPNAKTRNQFETVIRDLTGTVWIDEADRVLVRGQAHFTNDFRIGGGLLADIHKGSSFDFQAKRVNDAVWLPGTIDGDGSVRVLLFAGFNGRLHLQTSDYRRFRTSATILPGNGVIGQDGEPVQEGMQGADKPTSIPTPGTPAATSSGPR